MQKGSYFDVPCKIRFLGKCTGFTLKPMYFSMDFLLNNLFKFMIFTEKKNGYLHKCQIERINIIVNCINGANISHL